MSNQGFLYFVMNPRRVCQIKYTSKALLTIIRLTSGMFVKSLVDDH